MTASNWNFPSTPVVLMDQNPSGLVLVGQDIAPEYQLSGNYCVIDRPPTEIELSTLPRILGQEGVNEYLSNPRLTPGEREEKRREFAGGMVVRAVRK
jgi:hypothetical protein